MSKFICIRGARQNNLQGIDLDLPLGQLIVVTGPSGSGKSSLAFDTIYAEGQRRYVETFSPYTRQFLDRMDKPRVDLIDGIPPAIAIEQANHVKSTRSTVGTITEINDYLKLFFGRVATAQCPECERPVNPETAQSITNAILREFDGETVLVTFPVPVGETKRTSTAEFFEFLKSQGYLRVLIYGKVLRTDEPADFKRLPAIVSVIQDRVTVGADQASRLTEAVETALRFGKDRISVHCPDNDHHLPFSSGWHCAHCDLGIRPPSPGLFTFNNPLGACPTCRGFGRVIGIDYQRVMPDQSLSLAGGVIKPFQSGQSRECQTDLIRQAGINDIDVHTPFEALSEADQRWVIDGEGDVDMSAEELWDNGRWYGIKGFFKWMESRAYKMHVRVFLSRYRSYQPCEDCKGGRFQPETLNFRLQPGNLTLPDLAGKPLDELAEIFAECELPPTDPSAKLLHAQITSRLAYLQRVGLGYLSLDRPTRSLSGGEIERVNLTTCLGASLVNALFVMDEPSVGLHPRDTVQLLEVIRALRDKGNTVMVVEHEETVIRAADYLVDIGPGRGESGGKLVFSGPANQIASASDSLTADYLLGRKSIPVPRSRRRPDEFIKLCGIRHNNLTNLTVKVPLGVFCCVTGVSGSGKSSLVHDVLYRNLMPPSGDEVEAPGYCHSIDGGEELVDIVMVDQSPLSRSPRSTPAVYLGSYDAIRQLFGGSPAAVTAGLTPGSFSFNSGDGRCDRCSGLGFEKVEMQFLSDLFIRCPECDGKRFQPHVLKILIDGKSIHDVLEMTVSEAIQFFAKREKRSEITGPLKLLAEVGLDYVRLGQPVNVLSGGESQRLKLIKHLIENKEGGSLLIFDEPTTGLHFDDIAQLLTVFQRLVDEGNSLVVIEHNSDVIKCADWVIDLGPEAGKHGGQLVCDGTPETVAKCAKSHTGRFLAPLLDKKKVVPTSYDEAHLPALRVAELPTRSDCIRIRGAREHNLKNIDVDIPRDKMVVVTGLSGSGKSTLAFDILFAEGQRRFLDSMSPYARQFVDQLEKPEVDAIDGLPPSVAIEQRVTRGGGKSTVATVTEIYHFLRLLFSKMGVQYCPDCRVPVEKQTVSAIALQVEKLAAKGTVSVFAPLVKARKGFHTDVARWAERHGFETLLVDGTLMPSAGFQKLERFKEHTIDVLIGEVKSDDAETTALPTVRRAIEVGKGTARLVDTAKKSLVLSTEMNCPGCARAFEELDPRMFSFNSPHGWCEHCRGFGEVWRESTSNREFDSQLEADLAEEKSFESLEADESSPCPVCHGARINPVSRAVKIGEYSLEQLVNSAAAPALSLLDGLPVLAHQELIAKDILAEIRQRLEFLNLVGLNYLSLDRSAKTLSGGESQRIRLAAQLGSNLRGVLYVLDEPTIGLHPRDNHRLLDALSRLAGNGNSLVIVEHDEDTMRRADHIIDLGPNAGNLGGEIITSGTLAEILTHPESLTAKYLRTPLVHPLAGARRPLDTVDGWIDVTGAVCHNLKNVDFRIPIQRLTVVSGISGSGKSSLVRGVLVPAVKHAIARGRKAPISEEWDSLKGADKIGAVLEVDQSPIGKTSRSTPATYIKVFDEIRKVFASLPDSRMRGYTASRFSFNNAGGRCENCLGQGTIKLEMNFLPATYMPCEECNGRRYNKQTLEVLYNGKSIGDIMDLTVAQSAEFFSAVPKIKRALDLLVETGLGYLKLGQPSPTLSGGEAQRLKLVTQLARRSTPKAEELRTTRIGKSTLYVLEEPTIGLHTADVLNLIHVLHRLVHEGGTVVVIEHHIDLVAEADYVIDVGPEAGDEGGQIIAVGTPEEVAKHPESRTAPFLLESLSRTGEKKSAVPPPKKSTRKGM